MTKQEKDAWFAHVEETYGSCCSVDEALVAAERQVWAEVESGGRQPTRRLDAVTVGNSVLLTSQKRHRGGWGPRRVVAVGKAPRSLRSVSRQVGATRRREHRPARCRGVRSRSASSDDPGGDGVGESEPPAGRRGQLRSLKFALAAFLEQVTS